MSHPAQPPTDSPAAHPEGTGGREPSALTWLAAGFFVVFAIAAVAFPAAISGGLVWRGALEGHPSWIALGGLSGLLWSAMLMGTIKRRR